MDILIDGVDYAPASEAANELKTTELRVLMLIKQKSLTGCMADGEWFVSRESLACLKTHGLDPIQKQKCGSGCSSGGCGCT